MAILRLWHTPGVRAAIVVVAIAACGGPERAPPLTRPPKEIVAPGLRLPDTVTPLAYELALDIDPEQEIFHGKVTIDIRIERASDHVWLHADQLSITKATWSGGTLRPIDVRGEQMLAYRFGRVVEPGPTQLTFEFSGRTTGEQEGLFRQRAGGAWYVFSQGESVFARRIVPCFDEPRWKTPWRVSVVVPRKHVVISNMPETLTTVLENGQKEVAFAPTPPLPSYLLALAIGPFDVLDAGTVGRNKVPVRVVVRAGEGKRAGVVAARLPPIVAAIETYLDDALPLTKLDIVGVPEFFGAMENPGLITFHEPIILGNPKRDAFANYFTYIAAHELVHQWFGNLITPAWWDHLWLSEAFASWLGDRLVRELSAYDDSPLRFALARREAIAADRETDAKPLWRHVTTTTDADDGFDAIAYAKGQLVLATFESFLGADTFRDRVRAYVKAKRGQVVTSDDVVTSLGVPALERYVATTGTPVVDLALRCADKPSLLAKARGAEVPVCITYGTGAGKPARTCTMVGARTEIPLGGTCPAWVRGNPDGGYYHVAWTTHGPRGPAPRLADLDLAARVIAGDDLAAALQRGELTATDAIAELRALSDSNDPYGQLGAVALARVLDTLVDDSARSAWTLWLAARFTERLAVDRRPPRPVEAELATALVDVVPADQFANGVTRRAHELLDKVIPNTQGELPAQLVALASVHGGDKLFDRIAARARILRDPEVRDAWVTTLGELGIAQVPKAVALVTKGELLPETSWLALARYFERPAMQTAAWRALKPELPAVKRRMSADELKAVMKSIAHLCDRASRDDVAVTLAGDKDLTVTLQTIDRCIARRAKVGDIAAALARN